MEAGNEAKSILKNPRDNPFQNIALSLSGGGYRAAAFHLGALRMLERLGLREKVSTLSTISGGTFTGLAYVLALKEGKTFSQFNEEFCNGLRDTDLLKLGLTRLSEGRGKKFQGRWHVLTAFADVYHDAFTKRKTLGDLMNGEPIHLDDFSFNATEFKTGLGFRFRISDRTKYHFGNANVRVPAADARSIRLGDILAASSCFPGGFEPLGFPHDFHWEDSEEGCNAGKNLKTVFPEPIALMDGGVYDNQGMATLLVQTTNAKRPTDLFIFSDVHQQTDSFYDFPPVAKASWFTGVSLRTLRWGWWLLLAMSAGTTAISMKFLGSADNIYDRALAMIPLLGSIVAIVGLIRLHQRVTDSISRIPKLKLAAWKWIKHLTVQQLIEMIDLRVSSLFALASGVFMKRVRSLTYDAFFNNEEYKGKLIANLIYDLPKHGSKTPEYHGVPQPWLKPGDRMRAVAERAAAMPTTLWFADSSELDGVVLSGEITLCFNILDYILNNYELDVAQYPAEVRCVFDKARKAYEEFQKV